MADLLGLSLYGWAMLMCPFCPTKRNLKQNLDDHITVMHPKESRQAAYQDDANDLLDAGSLALGDPHDRMQE